jgi:DNA-binding transcriptional LysR family regulator
MDHGQRALQTGAEPSGPLRIGAAESLLTYRLPEVLRVFRRHFPHVELIFRPYSNATIALELEAGKFDMVIHGQDLQPSSSITSIRLRTERVLLLADNSHPLAGQHKIKPADLAGQNLLLTEVGCSYREKLDRALALSNIRPANVTEFHSVEALKQCIALGMGIGLLPAIAVARELRQNHLKALHWTGPSLDIDTYILWHKDKWISPAMAAFMELVKEKLMETETRRNGKISARSRRAAI